MNKTTLMALAVFGALGLAFFATREKEVKVGVHELELAKVNSDALVEFSFGPLVLRSTAGTWTVVGAEKRFSADEHQVNSALQALSELKADDFVTDRPEKHAELEVDSVKGLSVKASTGAGVVRDLVLGKTSRNGGTYVRAANSDAVFVLNSALPYLARQDLAAWRKKTISNVKPEDVTRLTFMPSGFASWSLVADAGSWKLEGQTATDFRFDPSAAQRLVAQVGSLTAQGFADAHDEAYTQLKADLKDGKSLTISLGTKRPDGTYPLWLDGDAQTYLLPGSLAEALLKDPEGLRDTRLLRFEPAQVQRLSLTNGAKKTVVVKEGERWKLVEPKSPGFEFDGARVVAQLSRLAALRGQSVARGAALPKPTVQLELTLASGTQKFQLGELIAKGEDGLLYTMSAQDKAWLETGAELFKKQPPPPPSSGGAMTLDQLPPEIRAQIEKQMREQGRSVTGM